MLLLRCFRTRMAVAIPCTTLGALPDAPHPLTPSSAALPDLSEGTRFDTHSKEKTLNWLLRSFSSTVGKKVLVALSGLGLVIFLITHLMGNLQIFFPAGDTHPGHVTAMDDYAHALHEVPFLGFLEIGLLLAFLLHIGLVFSLIADNKAARGGTGYAVSASKRAGDKLAGLSSRTMAYSGIALLAFLVIHIAQMRAKRSLVHGPEAQETISTLVYSTLSSLPMALLYVVGSVLVAWHVFHGLQSAFRSVGVNHPKYSPAIHNVGIALALLFAIGFSSIPAAIVLAGAGVPILPPALMP